MSHGIMMENFDSEVKQKFTDIDSSIAGLVADINVSNFATYGDSLNQVYSVGEVGKSKVVRVGLKGRTIVNLLGPDGNCESTAGWHTVTATASLDSTNKVFGSNSIKITLTDVWGRLDKSNLPQLDITKYYCYSAYLKNGDATKLRILKDPTGGGVQKASSYVLDTTKFTRVFVKLQPSDLRSGNWFCVDVEGTTGQYAFVDGIMLNEITAAEYADANYVPPEYVDNNASVQHPVIRVPKKNLFDGLVSDGAWQNGVTYNPGAPSFICSKNRIPITDNIQYTVTYKTGKNFSIDCVSFDNIKINTIVTGTSGTRTFTAPAGTNLLAINSNSTDKTDFDNFMIEEGDTPTAYEPYQETMRILPYSLRALNSDVYDEVKKEGKMIQNVQYEVLDGNKAWVYNGATAGHKYVLAPLTTPFVDGSGVLQKYNNKLIYETNYTDIQTYPDKLNLGSIINVYISISNTDSGWGDAYTPSAAEIAAYFNGWVMFTDGGGVYNGTGAKYWAKKYCGVGAKDAAVGGSDGIVGSTGTTTLPTVVNDQGYTPYKLYYQLATPTIIDIPPVELPVFDKGNLVVKSSTIRPIVNYEVDNSVRAIKDSALKLLGFLANKVSEVDTLVDDDLDMTVISRDANGKPTEVRYVRLDGTLYKKVVPSNVDANGNYQTITETTYKLDGSTVLMTRQRTITYDANGNVDKRSKWKVI